MLEHEPGSVQERPLEMRDGPQVARHAAVNAAVEGITDDRMTDRAEVHADLVRAAGMNRNLDEGQRPELLGAGDPRDGFAAPAHPCGIAGAAAAPNFPGGHPI